MRVSNDSLNEAAHPGLHYSELSLQTPGPWGQECNPPTIPPFLSLGREEMTLNEPLSSDDEDLYFLACAMHPQDTFSSSLYLSINIHPSSTPTACPFCIQVCTHTCSTRHLTYRAYMSKPFYLRPSMDTVTQRRKETQSACGSVLEEHTSLLWRKDWFE